jgi:hypothetical protein
MKFITSLLLLTLSSQILASDVTVKVLSAVKGETYDLGIGSKVELTIPGRKTVMDSVFLGRMVNSEEWGEEYLFLDIEKTRIYMIDADTVKMGYSKKRIHTITAPVDQAGETCAAYAIFHFWRQMFEVGFKGNETLTTTMGTEKGRLKFLEQSIEKYYISEDANLPKIQKENGTTFGFKCKSHTFKEPQAASDFVYNKAAEGKPVMMEFNIGSDMVTSTYEVSDYENPRIHDARLWVPRSTGQRENGGHVIVVAGAFVAKGKKKLLILDSDWSEPRVWDLNKQLGKKTAIKEMLFYSCN